VFSITEAKEKTKSIDVLEELRAFEESKESRLSKKKQELPARVEKAKRKLDETIKNEQILFSKKRVFELKKAEEEAVRLSKKIKAEYEKSNKKLNQSFSKNFKAAVKTAFFGLLGRT
jgi:hypothetical protein